MARTRAYRRHQEAKMKVRCRRYYATLWNTFDPDPTWVGRMASTHFKPCSCWMCMNLRGSEGKTRQELLHELSTKEQIVEKLEDA